MLRGGRTRRDRPLVAHLTSVHRPTDTRILVREAATLAAAGLDVKLVAASTETWTRHGVQLVPVAPPRTKYERFHRTVAAVYRAARALDADVFHLHDPELMPVGLQLRRATGARVVYDVHEDMPAEIITKDWIHPWVRRPLSAVTRRTETFVAERVDLVVAATPTIAAHLATDHTVVVQNFPLLSELTIVDALPHAERPAIVSYVGDVTEVRGVRTATEAMSLVSGHPDARLVIAGGISEPGLAARIDSTPGRQYTDLIGYQDRRAVRDLLARSRVGLCVLHDTGNFVNSQPTKLYEYMAAGLPVIASDFPAWRRTVDDAGCGLLVDPSSPAELAEALTWILDHPREAEAMGRRGRTAVEEGLNWEREGDALVTAYRQLLGSWT